MRKYRYYEILEVTREATQDDINAAFRRLARVWHPDRNPDQAEAEAVFRRINSAYQVLNNESTRAEYDRSPVECPTCGTHEVMSTNDSRWQCKHCGCRFDASGTAEMHAIDAPSAPPLKRARFRAFQATQCSWCARFYNRESAPCPYSTPQTNCDGFKSLLESERKTYLANAAMPTLADDWLRPTSERGLIKKCTYCGALNPNPTRMNEPCWNCHRPLKDECPHCGLPMMYYDVERGTWRCANNQCGEKRFAFDNSSGAWNMTANRAAAPAQKTRKRRASQPTCPRCGAGLIYSDQQSMWCCVVCRHFFTPEQAGFPAPKDAPIPVRGPRKRGGSTPRPERARREPVRDYPRPEQRPMVRPRRKKTTGDYVLLAFAIIIVVVVGVVVILGMSGQFG